MLNGAIHIINKIPGVELSDINPVSLPRLEKGGIVKKQSFIAGENGEEAIVPLERNTQGLKKIAKLISDDMKQTSNVIKSDNSTVNNFNFTQNNNSPKSLSRYEIYRQTKNLINAAKGV